MKPLEFLAEVLPSPGNGHYCIAAFTKTKKHHFFTSDLENIRSRVKKWLSENRDVYFALATFNEPKSREAANAAWIKSIFIDMDGYESKKAAAIALNTFLEKTGLNEFGTP